MKSNFLKTVLGNAFFAQPFLLASLCLLPFVLKGQPIQITVALAPPYPVHWEDYAQFNGQTVVTLTNTSQTFQSIRLVPTITGQANGVMATLKPPYRPNSPISLAPLETKVLVGSQLRGLHDNLTLDDLDVQGVDVQQVIRTEVVPEGWYTLCVRAFEFNGTAQLSNPGMGCSPFQITWYDPPIVVNPPAGSTVSPLTPQFISMSWTPSGMPGLSRYRLEMMDLTALGLNANDAFESGLPFFFEKENLLTLGFPFGPAEPPLTVGHEYAIRVQAYDPMGKILFKNEGRSVVSTFKYGVGGIVPGGAGGGPGGGGIVDVPGNNPPPNNNGGQQNDPPPPPLGLNDPIPNPGPGDCLGSTGVPLPENQVLAADIPSNADFIIGLFVVKNVVMNFGGGSYSGTGSVMVNFLKTPVKVEFSGLKMNASRQVFSGQLNGIVDAPGLYEAAFANSKDGVIDLLTPKLKEIETKIGQPDRLVSGMNGLVQKGLPLGFDNPNYNIGILGLIFQPVGAWMNAVLGTGLPDAFVNDYLCFSQKGIPIQPNGFSANAELKLSLVKDLSLKLSTFADLKFLKGAGETFLTFDCAGFKNLTVKGELIFSRQKALPIDAQGLVIADVNTKVKGSFTVAAASNLTNLLAQMTLSHDFSIPQGKNLIFKRPNNGQKTPDLLLDFSETQAGDGFLAAFPQKGNAWKGVFLKGLNCVLPEPFRKNGGAVSLSISNFLMDKEGISGQFEIQNEVVKTSEGEAAGLNISLNYLKIGVEKSVLTAGEIRGKALTPISATPIGYECAASAGPNGLNFSFTVSELPGLDVEMWVAKINVVDGSTLTIAKNGQKWGAKLDISGSIGISLNGAKPGSDLKKFEMPSLAFEHLVVNTLAGTVPNFQAGVMELDNLNLPQIKLANFDLTIGDIAVKSLPGSKYGLSIPMDLSLIGQKNGDNQQENNKNTIGGGTILNFIGKYDAVKKRFVYDGIKLELIKIAASLGPLLELKGELLIYQDDQNFGDGFRGKLFAKSEGVKVELKFIAQFGKKAATRYCMIDAQIKFAPGIPIPGTAAMINGFGGGFWFNMNAGGAPPKKTASQFVSTWGDDKAVGTSNSGVVYTVKQGKIGFRAMISFCIAGSETAMNGDIEFGMQLDYEDMSLDSIGLAGNMFLMQGLNSRPGNPEEAPVHMYAQIAIVPENELFHGVFGVGLNIGGGLLTGGGEIEIHFDGKNDKWHIYAGKWDPQFVNEPWDDGDRINIHVGFKLGNLLEASFTFFGYFQIGNDIQGMPPVPALITDLLSPEDKGPKKPFTGTGDAGGNVSGIALGMGIDFNLRIEVLFFYAKMHLLLGGDIVLQKINSECGDYGLDYGVNGWYAKGQAYAYLHGEAGLQLDLWFWKGQLKLLDVTAAALLQAQLPNPIWMRGDFAIKGEVLNGLVKIDTDLNFELGEKCGPAGNPFDDYPMIANTFPETGAKDVSLFADPSVAFNFKKFKKYDVSSGGTQQTVMMQAFDADLKLEKKNKTTNKWELVPGKLYWNAGDNGATWVPAEMLAADHDFRFYAKVKGFVLDKNDKVKLQVAEDTSALFHTAKTPPDEFVWENIISTFPYPRQRFFTSPTLYYETENGHIRLQSGQAYVFQKIPLTGTKYEYVARFINVEQNKVVDVPAFYAASGPAGFPEVHFQPPWYELTGQKIHRFDLIRKQTTTGNQPPPSNGPQVASYNQMVQALLVNKKKLAGASITQLKKGEKRIFSGLYFRTSKFSNMQAKVNSMSVKKTGWAEKHLDESTRDHTITVSCEVPVVLATFEEGFDGYEMTGYDLGMPGVPKERPLMELRATTADTWLADKRKALLDDYDPKVPVNVKPADEHTAVIKRYWGVQSSATPDLIYRNGTVNLFGKNAAGKKLEMLQMEGTIELENDLRARQHLLGNEGLMRPSPPLSTAEINSAIAKGKQAGLDAADVNIFDLKSNVNVAPPLNLNLNLNGISPDKSFFAIVDYRPWLANQDWEFCKTKMIEGMAWWKGNDKFDHPEVLKLINHLTPKTIARPKGTFHYQFLFHGKYTIDRTYYLN